MEEQDLVTIVINTHNSKDYLHVSLPSVMAQTYSNLEILVADDCSTDQATIELLHEYAAKDPRIKLLFNQENRGVYYSRNQSISKAQGKYLIFLDDDDYMSEDCIERMHAAAVATQAPLTFCHIKCVKAPGAQAECTPTGTYIPQDWIKLSQLVIEGKKEQCGQAVTATSDQAETSKQAALESEWENGSVYDLKRELLLKYPGFVYMPISPMGKLLDTSQFHKHDLLFKEIRAAGDQEWCLRICCEFSHYALACFPGVFHVIRDGSLSHANSSQLIQSRCEALQLRYECLCKYGLIERFKVEHLFTCLAMVLSYRRTLDQKLSDEFRQKVYAMLLKQGYTLDHILNASMYIQKSNKS